MENNNIIPKKGKNGLIILVVILSLLVVGLGGYFVYDKFIAGSEVVDKEKPKDEVVESKTFADTILANNQIITTAPSIEKSDDKSGLYKLIDSNIHYFRGMVENNYVSLGTHSEDIYIYDRRPFQQCYSSKINAIVRTSQWSSEAAQKITDECASSSRVKIATQGMEMIWRIVSIDEDNSVKLILDNTTNPTDYNQSESNGVNFKNSTVKNTLDKWYNDNLIKNNLDTFVKDSIFCNDLTNSKRPSSNHPALPSFEINKSLKCPNEYQITNKVGMLTADEYLYAGGTQNGMGNEETKQNTYLAKDEIISSWWTMTTGFTYANSLNIYIIDKFEGLQYGYATRKNDIRAPEGVANAVVARPVISLMPNITVDGDGTQSNPYKIIIN